MYDVAIAGAGPAGLATAILAGRRGLSVIVLGSEPRAAAEAGGVGISPCGVDALQRIGAFDRLGPEARAWVLGLRCFAGDGGYADGVFAGRAGLGVRWDRLLGALRELAVSVGARLRPGGAIHGHRVLPDHVVVATAGGPVRARLLVGAEGAGAPLALAEGLARPVPTGPTGVRAILPVAPRSALLEVHLGHGALAWVTPVSDRAVAITLEHDEGAPPGALARRLSDRLGVPVPSPSDTDPPSAVRLVSPVAPRVACVGAASVPGPLLGVDLTAAMALGAHLPAILAAGGTRSALAPYARAWMSLQRRRLLAGILRLVAARPALRGRMVRTLAARPWAGDRLVGWLV
jgi:menaquinone-9 beta-reductase